MKPKSPLTKKLVGGQHRLPEGLKSKILASPAKDYSVEKGSHNHPHSPTKHRPWSSEHKENAAHPNTAEAHNASPAKNYKSDAQRKAVHASKADGGKGAPTKKKENFGTGDKKTERKLNRITKKMQKQHGKQDRNEDKGTKRGDKRADKAHAKGRKLLAKGRAIKKASDERTANLKEVGPPKEPIVENSQKTAVKKKGFHKMPDGTMMADSAMKKRGLWDNIHAKRKRGEKMRAKGAKGAPTEKANKESQSPAKNYKKGYYGV